MNVDSNDDTTHKVKRLLKGPWPILGAGIIIGFIVSVIIFGTSRDKGNATHDHKGSPSSQEKKIKYWTCSMHPQIKLPKEGLCPICAMDLIPVHAGAEGQEEGSEVSLTLNEAGRMLAEIETSEVKYESVANEVRLVGKVEYDETKLSYISAWVPGRIDRLFVDFTGTKVRKGDHLIKLYSPELISTQEEYLQAIRNWEETKSSELSVMRGTAEKTLTSSKEKLRLFGITERQIEDIKKKGKPQEHLTIYSSVAGTVIQKNGFEGMYVKTGDKIYTIADLSKVWLYLDAYESDLQWLHYGQHVVVEAEGYPGMVFHGKVAFIDPFVDTKTRTIKLRVNVDNEDDRLKPGMFVRATIKATLGEGGKIYEEDLAAKWICPMHPDIVKDHQEPCDICEMDLIPTKEFGFAEKPTMDQKVLTIPKSAPLITGKRAVVYVENINDETGVHRYEGREVVLGPQAGEHYIILSGLKAGERVVTKGNFKIDSALQIHAKPSMMNPAGFYSEKDNIVSQTVGSAGENAGAIAEALPYYLDAFKALAHDDAHTAASALEGLRDKVEEIIKKNKLEAVSQGFAADLKELGEQLTSIDHDIKSLRVVLRNTSLVLKDILEKYDYKEDLKIYLAFCPMAFSGDGGHWIQDEKEIANPYYGERMLRCGEIQAEYGMESFSEQPTGKIHDDKGSKGSHKGSGTNHKGSHHNH
ncbi:MAG: efflux RND transporter periplasmic adaptor subunit [Candidatus Omnitrophica bacterium]|nr:efflux RND transporter periplasmic adaptor subunit [Candidatus Omnitrophota bacterium]